MMNFRRQQFLLVLGLVGWFVVLSTSSLRAADVTLPEGWQQMTPADFAAALRPIIFDTDSFENLSYEEQTGAKERGQELFLLVDLTAPEIDFPTVEVLHWLCRGEIDRPTRDQAAAALLARQDDWANHPYADVRAKIVMMMRLKIDNSAIVAEARRWVAAGGTFEQIPPGDLQYERELGVFTDAQYITGEFSVEWNGFVTAPETGEYKFSISPINVNAGVNPNPCKFQMNVSVGGQLILESLPEESVFQDPSAYLGGDKMPGWVSESHAVTLTAGTPTQIQVKAIATTNGRLPDALLHAMLYWEGPGVSKALVPSANLSTAEDGGEPGLTGVYRWHNSVGPQVLTRVDPQIDFAWSSPNIPLPEDPTMSNRAVNTMWRAITDSDYLPSLLASGKVHPLLLNPDVSSASLSSARRQQFLETLVQNPSLLDRIDLKTIVRIYQAYRFGTPDKALEMFGAWASRHPDVVGEMSLDNVFEGDERFACATLAICVTQQLPNQAARLQQDFLVLPDGRCSLPVAYTLACSYLGLKKYGEWIDLLDGKLADGSLSGDQRVNWLIARANAAELSESSSIHYPKRYFVPYIDPRNGLPYLEQALEAAQNPENKLRVAKEIAIRRIYFQEFDQAKTELQSVTSSLPAEQQAIIVDWVDQVDRFKTEEAKDQIARKTQAKETHLNELRSRRNRAAQRGSTSAVERYDSLISAATQGQ